MLSSFGISGAVSVLMLLIGAALTAYGVVTRESRNGLMIAIASLPILATGIAIMSIALTLKVSP